MRALQFGYAQLGQCPYLPDRSWAIRGAFAWGLGPERFEELLSQGYRRMGEYVYLPHCSGCQQCIPLRIPVSRYTLSKSELRVLRRNQDVRLEVGPPHFTEEKLAVYRRFLAERYPSREKVPTREDYLASFGNPLGLTHEFRYLVGSRLVALGTIDLTPGAASSVYFYFDPDESKRSLGVYSVLQEIDFCRRTGREYDYLGFYVPECRAMAYKAQYHPHERLTPDGRWVLFT
ncbi:MAG: arginyltransferase [Candidatus Xenobia bacterium]